MEEFRISEDGLRQVRRRMLTRVVPVAVLVLALMFMSAYLNRTHPIKTSEISGGLIIVFLVGSVVYSGSERAEELLGSYVITIDKHSIRREQVDKDDIVILIDEITGIYKRPNGNIVIAGDSNTNKLIIPAQIDKYEKLEQVLTAIQPFSSRKYESILQQFAWVQPFIILGLFAAFHWSTDKIIAGISGTVLILLFVWTTYSSLKNHNLNSAKRNGLIAVMAVFFIVRRMYLIFG